MDDNKYVIQTYNKIADKYAGQYFNNLSDRPYFDKFLSYLTKGSRVLDIGCGNGNFSKYISDQGFDCEGIDLSPKMLKIARERLPGIKFTLKDMRKLDYDAESFDGLLVAYSLIHIPSDQIVSTLQGFNKILESKGIVLLITQKGEPDKVVDEPLEEGRKIFINFFTKERLADFLNKAGFEVIYQEEKPIQDTASLSDTVIYTIARKEITGSSYKAGSFSD